MAIKLLGKKTSKQSREMRTIIIMLALLIGLVGLFLVIRQTRRTLEVAGEERVPTAPAFDVLPEFEPLSAIDPDYIEDHTWDRRKFPKDATEIVNDHKAIFHAIRFLRTVEKEGIDEAFPRVDVKDYEVLSTPPDFVSDLPRGILVRLVGAMMQPCPYTTEKMGHLDGAAEAGVSQVSCSILSGVEVRKEQGDKRRQKSLYLVVSPVDMAPWGKKTLLRIDGVFLKVWPLQRGAGWQWMPMVVALRPVEVEMKEDVGGFYLKLALGAIVVITIVLTVLGRKDARLMKFRRKRDRDAESASGPPPSTAADKEAGDGPDEEDAQKEEESSGDEDAGDDEKGGEDDDSGEEDSGKQEGSDDDGRDGTG